MTLENEVDRESVRPVSRRRLAKFAVAALGVAGFAGTGMSGAVARHSDGWDDDSIFTPSGGFAPSGGSAASGGSGWDDDSVFPNNVASGGSGWDDDWDDD